MMGTRAITLSSRLFRQILSILMSAGVPGKTLESTTPQFYPQVVEFYPGSEQLEVVLLVSNFHHRKGGAPVKEVTAISDVIIGCSTFAPSGSNVKAIVSSGYSIDPVMSNYEKYSNILISK